MGSPTRTEDNEDEFDAPHDYAAKAPRVPAQEETSCP